MRRALEFAETKESDLRSANFLNDKMQALKRIAITQAETGNWQAAQETRQKILKWRDSEPILHSMFAEQPDSLVSPLAHSQAKAGDVRGARALAEQEADPEVKAQVLLGIAGGILSGDLQ